jgi:hypothetical protein
VYDPIETLQWMLDESRAALAEDTAPAADGGRPRKKTKAQKADEALRVDVLTEALWNISGRPASLPEFAAQWTAEREVVPA